MVEWPAGTVCSSVVWCASLATPGVLSLHNTWSSQSPVSAPLTVMARGYSEPDPDYRPSRPTRRAESQRYGERHTVAGYSAHYAESPVISSEVGQPQPQPPRTLPRSKSAASRSRHSTLPRPEVSRSASRASRAPPGPPATTSLSKVTRSRSWGARPGGVVLYNRHGEPVEATAGGQAGPPPKAPSTIGVGYRPNTALSGKSVRSNGTNMTAASGLSTVKSKNTMKAGLAVETMSAPNPFCPNTKVRSGLALLVKHLTLCSSIFSLLSS